MHYVYIVLATVCYFSGIEWHLHRYVMHRPLGKFRYPYEAHALTHHRIFRADETYHLINEKDKWTIPMAWWNGPALVAGSMVPVILVGWFFHSWALPLIGLIVGSAYYGAYERVHWCMHLPLATRRWLMERWLLGRIFRRLNGHHLLHHRYMRKNFNVVLPLWDLIRGTLLVRSPVIFQQARGPSVPDVQPKAKKPLGDMARSAWVDTI